MLLTLEAIPELAKDGDFQQQVLIDCEAEMFATSSRPMGMFRLLLACSVLLEHTKGHGFFGLGLLNGRLAVQTFFIISGFYMALVLNQKYTGPGRYWPFLVQRFLRLYPSYLMILGMALVVDGTTSLIRGAPFGSLQPWFEYSHLLTPSNLAVFVQSNLNLLGQLVTTHAQMDKVTGQLTIFSTSGNSQLPAKFFYIIRPSWTLGIEFAFYILAPVLVCRSARFQAVVLLASVILRCLVPYLFEGGTLWTYVLGTGTPLTYVFFPSNLCFFMAGSLGYLYYKRHGAWLETTIPRYRWILFAFGVFMLIYNRLPLEKFLYLFYIPLVCVMVPVLFAATRKIRWDRTIGELSFPFYLFHLHVLWYSELLFARRAQWIYGPFTIAVTVLLSYLFYRFIESKTELYREQLYEKMKARAAVLKEVSLPAAVGSQG